MHVFREVGIHGIIIKFTYKTHPRQYSATYLPEVAKEQGWTQQQTIKSLVRKAGYTGTIPSSNDDFFLNHLNIKCTRYQSSKDRVTFDDFIKENNCNSYDQDHLDPCKLLMIINQEREKKKQQHQLQSSSSSSNGWRSLIPDIF